MMIFETNRLIIRRLSPNDIPAFTQLHTDPAVMNMIPAPVMTAEACAKNVLDLIAAYEVQQPELIVWAIILKDARDFIGTCAVVFNFRGGLEIGYRFNQSFWGKGYASETLRAFLPYLYEKYNPQLIYGRADVRNPGSVRVLSKFMDFVGEEWNEDDQCMDKVFVLENNKLSSI